MSWRTVIISHRAKLDYKMGYLVVRGEETHRVLVDEIAILLLENPAVALTGCLVEKLIEKKVRVIFCDSTRTPAAELTPHHGSHDSSANLRCFISEQEAEMLIDTILSHEYNVIMLEAFDWPRVKNEVRCIIDNDLCEIS